MNINITLPINNLLKLRDKVWHMSQHKIVVFVALALSITSIFYFVKNDTILAYGDAESHINIAKRVVDGITPGFAQLGGVWLPLPHILMIPFVALDPLWRSGLAGAIVSGCAYIISGLFIYKLVHVLTKNKPASFFAFLVFATNPNILYMQTTPMTELSLIMFFVLSIYYFVRFLKKETELLSLLLASLFGFLATLTRYDGWFLVLIEALTLLIFLIKKQKNLNELQGKVLLFATPAFFGILLWLLWGLLILSNPLYFSNSQFSAGSQQQNWLLKNELPAYHNIPVAFLYYFVTSMSNAGVLVFILGLIGCMLFFIKEHKERRILIPLILLTPFLYYVLTLYAGQSVIFIPSLTPVSFEWRLFNVRYGLMMLPTIAIFAGYLFYKSSLSAKKLIVSLFLLQFVFFGIGYSHVVTLADGTTGLSASKRPDAEYWMAKNYDSGLVLIDDYARTISIIRSNIPMQEIIYIGNKPYWNESLQDPEKYATWIVMQKNDDIWKHLYDNPTQREKLYTYFQKTYTSPNILIFKRYKNS